MILFFETSTSEKSLNNKMVEIFTSLIFFVCFINAFINVYIEGTLWLQDHTGCQEPLYFAYTSAKTIIGNTIFNFLIEY